MDNILARKIQLRHNIDPCKPTGSTSTQGRKNTETSWKKSWFAQKKKLVSPDCPLPRTSDLEPRTSDLGPRTSNLAPRTSDLNLEPRASDLGPRTLNLEPRTSDLGPRTSDLEPRTSNLERRNPNLGPRTSNLGPRTSDLGPRTSDLGPRTSNLEPRTSDLGPRTADLDLGPRVGLVAKCVLKFYAQNMPKLTHQLLVFARFLPNFAANRGSLPLAQAIQTHSFLSFFYVWRFWSEVGVE